MHSPSRHLMESKTTDFKFDPPEGLASRGTHRCLLVDGSASPSVMRYSTVLSPVVLG